MDPSNVRKDWQQHYEAALEELDPAKTEENVHLAEGALFLRWQELSGNPDHHNERNEMKRASDELLRVKMMRLRWPAI